jgi:hypothetical protein
MNLLVGWDGEIQGREMVAEVMLATTFGRGD